jgi:hypothetical protein
MMPKPARIITVAAAALVVFGVAALAQNKDPFVGTWHLNLAKSKYSPGPAPKATTSTYEAAGKGYKISVKTEPASGPAQVWSYTTDLDGKDSKITGNNPNADTAAAKRIDALTLEIVNKKGGKVMSTQKNVVSADGKTRTVTTDGTGADGQKVHNVAVYEKH